MAPWPFWVFVAVLVVLHFLLHVALGLGAGAPDLLTVAALLSARRVNRALATLIGGVFGMLGDALALAGFGAGALALAVVSYLGARSRDFFVGDSRLFMLAYLFAGKWLHDVLYYVFARMSGGGAVGGTALGRLLVAAPLAALYAAIAGGIALGGYRWLSGQR